MDTRAAALTAAARVPISEKANTVMKEKKPLTEAERALIDHKALTSNAPRRAKLADGQTVAQARAAHERHALAWEAARQKRKAQEAGAKKSAQAATDAPRATTPEQETKTDGGGGAEKPAAE